MTRPSIIRTGRELHELTDATIESLHHYNDPPKLFTRGGQLTEVMVDEAGARLEPVKRAKLLDHMSRAARWEKRANQGENTVVAQPPVNVADAVLAFDGCGLPVLNRVVTAPVFGPDGDLVAQPGYHPGARVFFSPASDELSEASSRYGRSAPDPDSDRIVARKLADELLNTLLRDFPFDSDASRANAVGLLLLPFVREMINGPTPLHLLEAPSPGSGKSLLTEALLTPALGTVPFVTAPKAEEEWDKTLVARLRAGPTAIVFDNVAGKLDSGNLAAALTSNVYSGRILGASEVGHFPVRNVWAATLNNAQLSKELTRRSVRIRIDPKVENPSRRARGSFAYPDLRSFVSQNRHYFVVVALSLVRAWLTEGEPPGSNAVLGSYEEWSKVIGGILDVAGIEGFLGNMDELFDETDVVSPEIAEFFRVWVEEFDHDPVQSRDVVARLGMPGNDLRHACPSDLMKGGGRYEPTAQQMGMWCQSHRDAPFGGLKLEKVSLSSNRSAWRVVPVEPQ